MSEIAGLYEPAQAASTHDAERRQYLSFRVGDDDYAIDILPVREIKGWTRTTVLPNQPDFVRGVMNLRGAIVPVFDLRCRFGGGLTEVTHKHVVIIAAVGDRLTGLLVDQVSDILAVDPGQIGPVPETTALQPQPYLSGLVTIGDHMVVLLALDHLFATIIPSLAADAAAAA